LGGELVDRVGVGVDRGAHLDARQVHFQDGLLRDANDSRNTESDKEVLKQRATWNFEKGLCCNEAREIHRRN
jgi:hypothetical protein